MPGSKDRCEWKAEEKEGDESKINSTNIFSPLSLNGSMQSFPAIMSNMFPVYASFYKIDKDGYPTEATLYCPGNTDITQNGNLWLLPNSGNQVLNCLGVAAEAAARRFFCQCLMGHMLRQSSALHRNFIGLAKMPGLELFCPGRTVIKIIF